MYKARRVVRTESNYCINQAELKGMKDAGFDEYEFISLGEEAEDVCDTCDDLDGERFKISEAAVGVNCPPMHPFCRCKVTTPQETLEDIQADIDRMLEGTSIEEIEQRLDQMIAEREALPESDSTLNSAQEAVQKTIDNSENHGIIEVGNEETTENDMLTKERDLEQYVGQPITRTDNEHIREWYYANVHDIPNQIDRTKSLEEQAKQAFDLRNSYKHTARAAMTDVETVKLLEEKRPAPTFDELLENKINRKGLTREEAIKDILETSSKTNSKVDSKFGL